MKACVLNSFGSYKNLVIKDIPEPKDLGPNDVLIRHVAIGVNFDDIMLRKGLYQMKNDKNIILGTEGVAVVQKKGENVKSFNIGDKVGYGFSPIGAYSQLRVIDYRFLIAIPQEIEPDIAAAILRKGMTAEYLLFKVFRPSKEDWIIVHSVAGGVGHLLAKWAKFCGLNVIGTVCDDSKISIALATGCNFVINRKTESISKKVLEYTEGKGVRVVYDGIGKTVFEDSIASLSPFGLYVSYGYSGGFLDPIDCAKLRDKSLFLSVPRIEMYKSNRYELIYSCSSIFEMAKKGVLSPNIARYTIEGIPQAHADLESGKSTGSIVVNIY
jgi:NADPH2:quinone reductase